MMTTAQQYNPSYFSEMDGKSMQDKNFFKEREVNPVNSIDARFKCPLCFKILEEPIQTKRGMVACSSCYKASSKLTEGICPLDGQEQESGSFARPDKSLAREISKIEVKCYYSQCNWTGALYDINDHEENSCDYAKTECENCKEKVLNKDFKKHRADGCERKSFACLEMDVDEVSTLPELRKCPGCEENFPANKYQEHIYECNEQKTCPYQVLCKCNFDPSQGDVMRHMKENHNYDRALLASSLTVLEENKVLKQELDDSKYIIKEQTEKLTFLADELEKYKTIISSKNIQLQDLRNQVRHIEQSSNFSNLSEDDYTKRLKSIEDLSKYTSQNTDHSKTEKLIENLNKTEKLVEGLEKQQAILNANLSDADLKMKLLEGLSTNGRQIWRIDNFKYRLDQAKSGKINALHSPPCYTNVNEYKFCIRVYLNGDGLGKSSHLSIYFVLMKNHFDKLLKWPFHRQVTFKLINPNSPGVSKNETFVTDKHSSSFKQPVKDMNIAAGCPKFLRQDLVEDFLYDDSLFIETIVDEIKP